MVILKKFNILFFLVLFCILDIHSLKAAEEHPSITEVSDDFYIGKMSNSHHLWFVMERVTQENLPLWKKYIDVQNYYQDINAVILKTVQVEQNKKLSVIGELRRAFSVFESVLKEAFSENNEIWIAYVTKATAPSHIPHSMMGYDNKQMKSKTNEFAKDIEMFVTVTSSPKAFITSHMGIGRSLESYLEPGTTKGISIKLHSFAAQVMLMRNPGRKYMINTPVDIMREIIVKALPKDVFVGTKEDMEAAKKQTEPLDEDHQKFLKLMEQHPPILSTDGEKKLNNSLIIFDRGTHDQTWLKIEKTNENYKWMFTDVFKPTGTTNYLVVDLPALAKDWQH